MMNQLKDWIDYSSYWNTYNRVLLRKGGIYTEQIELELTPINDEWDEVKLCKIRKHRTSMGPGDKISHHLHPDIFALMEEKLGYHLAHFIFHYDIYTKLTDYHARRNWYLLDRYVFNGGGGIPLVLIDPNFDLLREDWAKGTSSAYADAKQRIMDRLNIGLDQVNDLSFFGDLRRLDIHDHTPFRVGVVTWVGDKR